MNLSRVSYRRQDTTTIRGNGGADVARKKAIVDLAQMDSHQLFDAANAGNKEAVSLLSKRYEESPRTFKTEESR